jgi:hypothetical protein
VTKSVAAVLRAVAGGEITADAGRDLVSILDVQRNSLELLEIERRVEQLERAKGDRPNV